MISKVHTAALNGLTAMHVFIETSIRRSNQESTFFMVGLPDSAVKESRTRVMAALKSSEVQLPPNINVDINLAPADVKKEGTGYDLPLAIALIASHNMINLPALEHTMLVGELGLDGSLRPVRGALPIAIKAREMGFENLIVPMENAREAAVVNRLKVFGADCLSSVVNFLNDIRPLEQTIVDTRAEFFAAQEVFTNDFAEVKGQQTAKRAMEVAAAGGHNIMLIGSPGCGKSMIAKRMPSILPPLTLAESLETTQIHSVAGKLGRDDTLIKARPFRSPHHTVSDIALIGGGTTFQPGEISLAHNGILFLDEFPEYSRAVLETLRQPLEDRMIQVSRARYSVTLPCSFQLVAAMNPCPCGHYHDPQHQCTCTPAQIQRYMNRISGPLLDRIDLQIEVRPVPLKNLATAPTGETSAVIRERVIQARAIQSERFKNEPGIHCNAQMNARLLQQYAQPTPGVLDYLMESLTKLKLSARAYERILKVSRTIADLAQSEEITTQHIREALSYRNLDRSTWGE